MRLLKRRPDGELELISFDDDNAPPYAILSHTWEEGQEVTYHELVSGLGKEKTGYAKICFLVDKATEDELEYSWVDTCSINKSTSDELSAAINSMFRWYQRAAKCYVYLSDVKVPEEVHDAQDFRITWEQAFRQSRWFTRGWTLQELLAPPTVQFFSENYKQLGTKISLEREIHEITKIPVAALRGRLSDFGVNERMSWAEKRKTTVKEDKAYCLLGIVGVFMPLIYGEGEEHAFLRLRKEAVPEDIPQASAKPSSNVPFRKDDDFIARGDILTYIDERCSRPAGRAALVGFGGFGKSQLAIEYAHRVRHKSPNTWVFWVHASNPARLEESFSNIAERVGLSTQSGVAADVFTRVRKWLNNPTNGQWLLIIDNLDEEIKVKSQHDGQSKSLTSLLPQSDHGSILITSRDADVARSLVGRNQDIVTVGAMSEVEAIQLLQNKLGHTSQTPSNDARQLVGELDCIPLAIIQAAAYINRFQPRMSVAKYLHELRNFEARAQLLRKAALDLRRDEQAPSSVFTAWQVSFDHIYKKRRSAAYLLSFMSFFNRQGIPEFMIRHYENELRKEPDDTSDSQIEHGEVDFEEDMALLRAFSLVKTTKSKDEFEMHGLVQLATQVWLDSIDAKDRWYRAFIRALADEFPAGEFENWPTCRILFPHVLPIVGEERTDEGERPKDDDIRDWALLLNHAGWYSMRQGQYVQAEQIITKALNVLQDAFGADDRTTLMSNHILSLIIKKQGRYAEAETMNRERLARELKLFGPEHPKTLITMNNLATTLDERGKFDESESIHRQVLALKEKIFGLDHPETLMSMNNLATTLDELGKYSESQSILTETLTRKNRVLGPEHPDTLITMSNLGKVLGIQGEYSKAESIHREALAGKEKVLGREHPDTYMSVYCLAYLLAQQRRYRESTDLFQRACSGFDAVLGEEHPDTRACHADYKTMLQWEKEDQLKPTSAIRRSDVSRQSVKTSRLSRTLAKLGIRSSRLSQG